jgi:hypothetical protein
LINKILHISRTFLKKVIEYIVMASENSDDPNFEICSLDENQVEKACEDLRVKNAELKKAINHMIKENTLYKKKYNEMKSQLTDLNKLLEKNAQVFHQLFDDAQSALQMGRTSILNSPAIHNRLSVRKANPKIPVTILPSTSNTSQSKSMTRRRLHIEPINMSELQETGENNVSTIVAEISEQPEQDSTLREGLSTILEENSNPPSIREVSVRLSRLDADTVKSHLSKQNSSSDLPQQDTTAAKETGSVLSNNSSLNVDDSLTFNCYPTDTSSPFKLEVMKKLGLVPTLNCRPPPSSPVPNFVNVRKKNNYERKCDKLISPKKEEESPQPRKKSKFLPKKEDSTNKKKKEVPSVELKRSPRLSRRAKPQMLREESLRK